MGFEFPLKQCRVWASYTAAPHGFTNVRKGPSLTYPNLYRVKCCRCSSGKFGSMPPLDRSQHFRIKGVPSPTRTTHKRLAALAHRGDYAEGSVAYQKVATIMSTGGHWPQTSGMAGVYYDDPDVTPTEDLRSHAGVLWEGEKVPEGLEEVKLDGGRYAVLHYMGSYAGFGEAYRYLYGPWLSSNQESLRDAPSYEHYLNDPTDTAPAELLTDIYMPLSV